MTLQILIPQYQENDTLVKELLDSIAIQRNVDFNEIGVIICNDGSDILLSDQLLQSYNFTIEYHKEPHRGASGTRNALLHYATAKYIMYCDADDSFFSIYGLDIIFRLINYKEFDLFSSIFINEVGHSKVGYEYLPNGPVADHFLIHGKVFRRQFILDNDITWDESLTISEDLHFTMLCAICSDNIIYTHVPIFLWKWNDNSCTRKGMVHGQLPFLISSIKIFDFLEQHNKIGRQKAKQYFLNVIFNAYGMCIDKETFSLIPQDEQKMMKQKLIELFISRKNLWDSIPYSVKQDLFYTNKQYPSNWSDFLSWMKQLEISYME